MPIDDPFELFRILRNPLLDETILSTVMPSDYFPKSSEYFRFRQATIACRGGMGDIWLCIEAREGAVVGRKVLDTYAGLHGRSIGEVRQFVAGDVIFYDCTKMWAAIEVDSSALGNGKKP